MRQRKRIRSSGRVKTEKKRDFEMRRSVSPVSIWYAKIRKGADVPCRSAFAAVRKGEAWAYIDKKWLFICHYTETRFLCEK